MPRYANSIGPDGRRAFFRQFLRRPREVGSIIPSSRFLERRILNLGKVESSRTIVELGPGTGGTTRAILGEMPKDGCLLSIELNPELHALVDTISDDRLIAHCGNAADLERTLDEYAIDPPDVVISGIPFSTMREETGLQVLEAVMAVLAPEGRFVAYQARSRVAELCDPLMGSGEREVELLNIPPMRVYRWEKNGMSQGNGHSC